MRYTEVPLDRKTEKKIRTYVLLSMAEMTNAFETKLLTSFL